jgi:hypothetical protein
MRVSKIHWTWYMYAGIPDPIVRTNKSLSKVPRKKNRKVEKTLEIYDREGKAKSNSKRNLIVKA